MVFEAALNWLKDDRGMLYAHHVNGNIHVTMPEVFGGSGKDWTPEQLLLGAVVSCYISTFIFFAKKMKAVYCQLECRATGKVELEKGKYKITKLNVFPTVCINNDAARTAVEAVIVKTQQHCIVSNAISAPIAYHSEVSVRAHTVNTSPETGPATAAK